MTKTMNYSAATATIAALMLSLFAAATPAFADRGYGGRNNGGNETDNSVKIVVANSAAVFSNTTATASTGGNWAGGSEAGNGGKAEGGNGGDVEDNKGGDNEAGNGGNGNGGNGGASSDGGLIATGDATANAGSMNVVNSTDIEVEAADCGCDSKKSGRHGRNNGSSDVDNSVEVIAVNEGFVVSNTDAYAKTGFNAAEGSEGGNGGKAEGGNGGDVEDNGSGSDRDNRNNKHHSKNGSNKGGDNEGGNGGTGNGGNGGNAGVGGTVGTGAARANSGSINVLNTGVVRVIR